MPNGAGSLTIGPTLAGYCTLSEFPSLIHAQLFCERSTLRYTGFSSTRDGHALQAERAADARTLPTHEMASTVRTHEGGCYFLPVDEDDPVGLALKLSVFVIVHFVLVVDSRDDYVHACYLPLHRIETNQRLLSSVPLG